jgi:chromosome segregation ATPase
MFKNLILVLAVVGIQLASFNAQGDEQTPYTSRAYGQMSREQLITEMKKLLALTNKLEADLNNQETRRKNAQKNLDRLLSEKDALCEIISKNALELAKENEALKANIAVTKAALAMYEANPTAHQAASKLAKEVKAATTDLQSDTEGPKAGKATQ